MMINQFHGILGSWTTEAIAWGGDETSTLLLGEPTMGEKWKGVSKFFFALLAFQYQLPLHETSCEEEVCIRGSGKMALLHLQ